MKPNPRGILFIFLLALTLSPGQSVAQPFPTGSITDDLTLLNRTGEPVSLSDFAGHVILLDFFAFWCAPCAFSSPDIEKNIQQFYTNNGGNTNGIPVQVIVINIEPEDAASTDEFINNTELKLVVDDPDAVAWDQFNQVNGIPLFVIINGVENSPSHEQWEVLHNQPSYPGAVIFRQIIDSVEAPTGNTDDNFFYKNSEDLGDGWRGLAWFGSFNVLAVPWIYHSEHGWMFSQSADPANIWFWTSDLGWFWTSEAAYSWLFSVDKDSWLWYQQGSKNPRWFHIWNTQEWVPY